MAKQTAEPKKMTPMMKQYTEVKRGLPPGTLLLFRLGDFYEMFHEDAEEGARLLGITLTQRQGVPMAGIPYHAAESYIGKALAAGSKVAICDQVEAPRPGKLVKRSLTRIITPGTAIEPAQVEAGQNRFILALDSHKEGWRASWMDLSTGDFVLAAHRNVADLLPILNAIAPSELVVSEQRLESWRNRAGDGSPDLDELLRLTGNLPITELPSFHFETDSGARAVAEALKVLNLDGFGLDRQHPALGAAGALVHYVTENLCARPENLRKIREYRCDRSLLLDPATLRNLEIFTSASGGRDGSLAAAIDHTVTAAGTRLLNEYLSSPPLVPEELRRRQSCVGELLEAPSAVRRLRERLQAVRDIPRILGRLQNRLRNPRELGGVRETLRQIPDIRETLATVEGPALGSLRDALDSFPDLAERLEAALSDELPGQLTEGGYIRPGYDGELDRLLSLTSDNKNWLADLERGEQERTGIKKLRVRFNNAFGYYIEVTKANLHLVPDDYIRKQTTVNSERFYTEALKQKEKEIFHAEENARARELEIFGTLVKAVLAEEAGLRETAAALAELDLFLGWAVLTREWNYCRPDLDEGTGLLIKEGRHPVVEQTIRQHPAGLAGSFAFVPNDTGLDTSGEQIMLITGPNMAGKSTYIRQVALITLLAQIGCWVPATECRLGLVDRIFSRVGASDELARGNSTFMVEMNETANILNNATERSLIVLDEIGRGTSTYDGLSIAWAVVENLHRPEGSGPRTLFATHYHELTQLDRYLNRVRNYSVSVKEWNDEIIFVRQVVPGPADRSYGIQVARLAGLPLPVINRAKEILERLESDDTTAISPPASPTTSSGRPSSPKRKPKVKKSEEEEEQLSLF